MCTFCHEHGRGDKWYYNLENFLFKKVFPTPEEQEIVKKRRIEEMAEIEWRERHPNVVKDTKYQLDRSKTYRAQVLTLDEVFKVLSVAEEAVKREDSFIMAGRCACALQSKAKFEYRCIFFGAPILWSASVGYGRYPQTGLTEFGGADWRELKREVRKGLKAPLKIEEAKELFIEWDKKGLVHDVVCRGLFPLIDGFCNCERPICGRMRNRETHQAIDQLRKGHFVARVNPEKCTSCGTCMDRCQFGAIYVSKWSEATSIESLKCFGCGLCATGCPNDAIQMVERDHVPIVVNEY